MLFNEKACRVIHSNIVTLHSFTSLDLKVFANFAGYCNIVYQPTSWWNCIFNITDFCVKISNCPTPKYKKKNNRDTENILDQSFFYTKRIWCLGFFPLVLLTFRNTLCSVFEPCSWDAKLLQYLSILKLVCVCCKHWIFCPLGTSAYSRRDIRKLVQAETNWENVCSSIWNNHNRINNKIFTMTQ